MIRIHISGDDIAPCIIYTMHDEVRELTYQVWDNTWHSQDIGIGDVNSSSNKIPAATAVKILLQQRLRSNKQQVTMTEKPFILRRRFKAALADN